mgnify:FL=1
MSRFNTGISAALATLFLAVAISACERKGPAEKAGEKIDDAARKAGEQIEKAGDKMQDAVKDDK